MERDQVIHSLGEELGSSFLDYITHGNEAPEQRSQGRLKFATAIVTAMESGDTQAKISAINALLLATESLLVASDNRLERIKSHDLPDSNR